MNSRKRLRLTLLALCLGAANVGGGCRLGVTSACHDSGTGTSIRDLDCNGHCCVVDGKHRVYYAAHECTCLDDCPCWSGRLYGK